MKKLGKSSKGAALVEYGILVGLIAVLAIMAVLNLGGGIRNTFEAVSSQVSQANASAQDLANKNTAVSEDSQDGEDLTMEFTMVPDSWQLYQGNPNSIMVGWTFNQKGSVSGDTTTSHGYLSYFSYSQLDDRTEIFFEPNPGYETHVKDVTLTCGGTSLSLTNGNSFVRQGNIFGISPGTAMACRADVTGWEYGGGIF